MSATLLFTVAERFPPRLCRFVARKANGRRAMSHRDIAHASGLSIGCVAKLSLKSSWKGVDIDIVERFATACGVNLLSPFEANKYLTQAGPRIHVARANWQQRKFFERLMQTEHYQPSHD